ncbi:hypothetical protein Bpfe_015746 [Biomphalaria pfeifferi]|uniref:Uncharacterized protein n=1 Tax=Biomphalaria pfeifferi TaxID=112525 RepID=A0AAD8BJX5_BIOPF|nr:hypothetical protein Bpfe_015746 [Biomphalaria pfeifferi]
MSAINGNLQNSYCTIYFVEYIATGSCVELCKFWNLLFSEAKFSPGHGIISVNISACRAGRHHQWYITSGTSPVGHHQWDITSGTSPVGHHQLDITSGTWYELVTLFLELGANYFRQTCLLEVLNAQGSQSAGRISGQSC